MDENAELIGSIKSTGSIPTNFISLNVTAKIEEPELGLMIVKTIVESHDASFDVESIEGQGTTFILRFPTRGG